MHSLNMRLSMQPAAPLCNAGRILACYDVTDCERPLWFGDHMFQSVGMEPI
jgi:hypothetical protein